MTEACPCARARKINSGMCVCMQSAPGNRQGCAAEKFIAKASARKGAMCARRLDTAFVQGLLSFVTSRLAIGSGITPA